MQSKMNVNNRGNSEDIASKTMFVSRTNQDVEHQDNGHEEIDNHHNVESDSIRSKLVRNWVIQTSPVISDAKESAFSDS